MRIEAYQTHYKIIGYHMGDNQSLEGDFYKWDDVNFKRDAFYYYNEEEETLYLPRGYDEYKLEQHLHLPVNQMGVCNKKDKTVFTVTTPPRNDSQKEAIRFLLGRDEFKYTSNTSQLALSLPGGGGKTYCMVTAMSFFSTKAIVITHNAEIRSQWKSRILEYSNLPDSSIMTLTSTKATHALLDAKNNRVVSKTSCYLLTHRLLGNYMKEYGFHSLNELFIRLGIGLKIVDEAHLEFKDILMIDYATNVWKSFYLTATFARTDYKEDKIYQASFNRLYKLIIKSDEMGDENNTFYIASFFKSGIPKLDTYDMSIRNRFSVHRYFAKEMEYGRIFTYLDKWLHWYYTDKGLNGKAIILSPKKESCDKCMTVAQDALPDLKVGVHYSGKKLTNLSEYDIICATSAMLGTGLDLDGLRLIINLEPIGSKVNIDQIIHRLMRGNTSDNTFYIELIDSCVPHVLSMYKRRKKVIDSYVKKSVEFKEK